MAPLLSNFHSRQPLFSKSESGTASHFRNPSPPLVSGLPGRTRLPMPSHSRLTPSPLHYFKVRRERSSLSSALRTAKTASIHFLPAFDHSEVNIKNSCGECVECGGCNDIPARFRQSGAHEDRHFQLGTGERLTDGPGFIDHIHPRALHESARSGRYWTAGQRTIRHQHACPAAHAALRRHGLSFGRRAVECRKLAFGLTPNNAK